MVFTGIIELMGTVGDINEVDLTWSGGAGLSVTILDAAPILGDVKIGDSIAISGICLTVTEFDEQRTWFKVGIAPETVRKTNIGDWKKGDKVNLERAMTADTRMGGHMVQGHVDCTISIVSKQPDPPNSLLITFHVPTPPAGSEDPLRFVVNKGYVCLNGTSLTVVSLDRSARTFSVMLIAHTQTSINLPLYEIGGKINLEVDEVGKYVESVVGNVLDGAITGASESSPAGSVARLLLEFVDARIDARLKEHNLRR